MTVPYMTMAILILNLLLGVAVPLALLLVLKKKYGCSVKAFLVGCGVMLLFAFVLESGVHALVLNSTAGLAIRNNVWLYGLYGGVMAALFEETGRFLGMKYLLKQQHENPANALMYGAGHGGFEMFVLLSVGMLNNIIYSVMLNAGTMDTMLTTLDEANRQVLLETLKTLSESSPLLFVVSPLERLAAVAAQIAMSIIVWQSVTRKGMGWCWAAAFGFHFLLDAVSAILMGLGVPVLAIEIIIWISTLLFGRFAWKLVRDND